MARLVGPVDASRSSCVTAAINALTLAGAAFNPEALVATVYADAACTTLADILTTTGGPVYRSRLSIGADWKLPQFQFPDGASTVYVRIAGSPATAVYAVAPVDNAQYDQIYNIRHYGAVCDGVTDDSAAWTAAFTALGSSPGVVYCPGQSVCAPNIIVLNTGQWLLGDGVERSMVIQKANTSGPLVSTTNFATLTGTISTQSPYNCGFRLITLDGNKANQSIAITPPPTISSVTPQGTPGTSTWTYIATAIGPNGGESVWSAIVGTSTGAATLNGTNYNQITIASVPAAGWNLYRCPNAGGDQICNMQRVNASPIMTSTYNDQGAALQANLAPFGDTTVPSLVSMYAYAVRGSDFVIRNAVGNGLWTEWSTVSAAQPGTDAMESFWTNYKIHDCNGDGWVFIGPHDTQSVNAIIFKNGSNGATGYAGVRMPTSNGATNGSVLSHTHVFGGTMQYGVYCGASGIRIVDHIGEGGTSAQVWINAAQVQMPDCYLYSGGVNTASVKGIILGSSGYNINGLKASGEITNCGGCAIDWTHGGDNNHVVLHHFYFSGTTPTGSTLGVIGTIGQKSVCDVTVFNNTFATDASSTAVFVGPERRYRATSSDTRDMYAVYDETGTEMYAVDYKGRPRSKAGSTPTIAVGSNIGTGGTVSISGTDYAGTITITTGSTVAAGQMAAVTFSTAFGATPQAVVLTSGDSASAAVQLFATKAASGFSVRVAGTPGSGATYTVNYVVIGS